ncbi:MAG: hypothetical protein Kow0099_18960 [Candidatus Abyssubacteria bacterium]
MYQRDQILFFAFFKIIELGADDIESVGHGRPGVQYAYPGGDFGADYGTNTDVKAFADRRFEIAFEAHAVRADIEK